MIQICRVFYMNMFVFAVIGNEIPHETVIKTSLRIKR